jgi:TrmH family RNA methyltransferase
MFTFECDRDRIGGNLGGRMRLSNIRVVCVEPQYPGNVGAIARSCKNYGVDDIRIVGDLDFHDLEARRMALYGFELLRKAIRSNSLNEAVAECSLIIGTVHQTRFNRSGPKSAWDLFHELKDRLSTEKVALVLGREDNGLTREEVDLCHALAMIPTPHKLSFNVAHSATVFLYELNKAILNISPKEIPRRPKQTDYNELMTLIHQTLKEIDFFRGNQEDSVMISARDLIYRSNLHASDIPIIRAFLYRVLKHREIQHESNKN